jgi:hypothetical protein
MRRYPALAGLFLLTIAFTACDPFYDEGARLSQHVCNAARQFQADPRMVKDVLYTPKYGEHQTYRVTIGASRYCPQGKCDPLPGAPAQGAVTVHVEHGSSGTGYAHTGCVQVPAPLDIAKQNEPLHIFLRKENNVINLVALK